MEESTQIGPDDRLQNSEYFVETLSDECSNDTQELV